ncbi:hypothetical protein Tco_0710461 [Tanacetum coccineum]
MLKLLRVKNMTTAGDKYSITTSKGNIEIALKKSRWFGGLKEINMDHESKKKIFISQEATKAYLSDYEDYNGGFVAFGSDPKGGKITGKGKIRTAYLDFDDVYFVDELKFNLFSVSQMLTRKTVSLTDTECLHPVS